MTADALAEAIRTALHERGVEVMPDELEEIEAAYAGLSAWIAIVERLANGPPAFVGPLR